MVVFEQESSAKNSEQIPAIDSLSRTDRRIRIFSHYKKMITRVTDGGSVMSENNRVLGRVLWAYSGIGTAGMIRIILPFRPELITDMSEPVNSVIEGFTATLE